MRKLSPLAAGNTFSFLRGRRGGDQEFALGRMAVLRGWGLKLSLFFFLEDVRKNEEACGVRRQRVFEATPLCLTAGSESSSAKPLDCQRGIGSSLRRCARRLAYRRLKKRCREDLSPHSIKRLRKKNRKTQKEPVPIKNQSPQSCHAPFALFGSEYGLTFPALICFQGCDKSPHEKRHII